MNYEAKALTIAGSDSGGGAGIQADLKTFQAFSVYGMSAITSITAQNTTEVRSIFDIDPKVVKDQIEAVLEDIGADAVKIGMLSNAKIIKTVASCINKYNLKKVVLDPVMITKTGAHLLKQAAEKSLTGILPLAMLITPNLFEAEKISGMEITNIDGAKKAAQKIYNLGIKNILIKGGHLPGHKAIDILYDGKDFYYFESKKINTKNTHGTGCTYSSAIAALLAKGRDIIDAVQIAKNYIYKAIKEAPGNIGSGSGPLYHNTSPYNG